MTQEDISEDKVQTQTDGEIISHLQKDYYQRDGFLVIKNFISKDICDHLVERASWLIDNFNPEDSKTAFSAKNQSHAKHTYFLDSGNKIHFFFEEAAITDDGKLLVDKALAINKIGHALHDLDPVFNLFSRTHKIATLVKDLGVTDPLLLQSMYICKQPHIGGEVTCHQDNTYLYGKDQPVTGLWFALEDATLENGCLWAIPGGHRTPLKSRMTRNKDNHVATETYDDTPWSTDKMIPLEVPRGSLVVLHGLLPHMSKENVSARSRHAYTLHFMSQQGEYAEENWLQRDTGMPFKGFL